MFAAGAAIACFVAMIDLAGSVCVASAASVITGFVLLVRERRSHRGSGHARGVSAFTNHERARRRAPKL